MSGLCRFFTAAIVLLAIGTATPARASLGGKVESIQADRVSMQGALIQVSSASGYSVHEMRAATGTMVREFVTPDGTVFGVAWQGPAIPDMRQILGAYFDAYAQAAKDAQAKRLAHGPLLINDPNFVVQQSGHMRAFSGRAYVPQLMPSNVTIDVIK
jgi:hypothetical protein